MTTLIRHRINRIEALHDCDPRGGVEIDLRSDCHTKNRLHLSHDPFSRGVGFDDWLQAYAALGFVGPLVVNTKEDGLEEAAISALFSHGIENYFFLDTTPPSLVRGLARGLGSHLSLRISRFEPAAQVQAWFEHAGSRPPPGWAWIDCFAAQPLPIATLAALPRTLRYCLVSPELQGGNPDDIAAFAPWWPRVHAVCTKYPAAWQALDLQAPQRVAL